MPTLVEGSKKSSCNKRSYCESNEDPITRKGRSISSADRARYRELLTKKVSQIIKPVTYRATKVVTYGIIPTIVDSEKVGGRTDEI